MTHIYIYVYINKTYNVFSMRVVRKTSDEFYRLHKLHIEIIFPITSFTVVPAVKWNIS